MTSSSGNVAPVEATALRASPLWAESKTMNKTTTMCTTEVISRFFRNVGLVSTVDVIALGSLGSRLGDYAHLGNAGSTNGIHYPDEFLHLQLMVSLDDDSHLRVLVLQLAYLFR